MGCLYAPKLTASSRTVFVGLWHCLLLYGIDVSLDLVKVSMMFPGHGDEFIILIVSFIGVILLSWGHCSFRAWGEPAWVSGVRMERGGPTSLTPRSNRLS